jgi:N-acetylglucosamine kinase-like BadF-type ATPase
LLQFLSLVGEDPNGAVKRTQLLRDIAQSMDIDPDEIIKTEEQLALEQQQQQQLLQAQMQQAAVAGDPAAQGNAGMGPPTGLN